MSGECDVGQAESKRPLSKDEIAALRELIAERMRGEFVSLEEGRARTEKMIAEKRKAYGL